MNINGKSINELILYFRKLDVSFVGENILSIYEFDDNILYLLFMNGNNEIKKYLIDDKNLFDRIMGVVSNRKGRLLLELIDDEVREYIYLSDNLKNSRLGKMMVLKYLDRIDYNSFSRIVSKYNFACFKNDEDLLRMFDKYDVFDTVKEDDGYKKINFVYFIKFKSDIEAYIFKEFGILVSVDCVKNGKVHFGNQAVVDYDFLVNVNRKHIIKLLNEFMVKEIDDGWDNNKLFVSVVKLYIIFGYDDARKIIKDNYTFNTPASLDRAINELWVDNRREFRLKNQKKYYYYGIEKEVLRALDCNDTEFFKNICYIDKESGENAIISLMDKFRKNISGVEGDERLDIIKNLINDEIELREERYKKRDLSEYMDCYMKNKRDYCVSIDELYEMFRLVNISYSLDDRGHIVKNKRLISFLLGNCKRDNDCLLRLVFNKQALGLDRELYNIINNFDKIVECIDKSNGLSLNSLLDVIDISKTFLYNLRPDELDITLETLSKILNSRKYLKESPEEIVKRVLELHKLRKHKVWGFIPFIGAGNTEFGYRIVDFDDQSLLTSGIDGGDCLKVGGEGEEFLKYCLTSPNGAIMYLYYKGKKYVLPCSRNGNMININSIDPDIIDENEAMGVMNILNSAVNEWIDDKDNGIDLVTITDIHMSDYIRKMGYKKMGFDYAIPLGEKIYTDYNKNDVTNYIISSKGNDVRADYSFVCDEKYYQDRKDPYIYIEGYDIDTERIEIFINNVYYSAIDYLNCSDDDKQVLRENYELLKVCDFVYIVGNKDWFIGVSRDDNILYATLPYDYRVCDEFDSYRDKVLEFARIKRSKGNCKVKKRVKTKK